MLHISMQTVHGSNDGIQQCDDTNNESLAASDDTEIILLHSTPHVQELLIYLTKIATEKANMKGVIIVQREHTARILCHIIRRYFNADENSNYNLHADCIAGENSTETVISKKNNIRVLEKFTRGDINLIIVPDECEPHIDCLKFNLVISFDAPQTLQTYEQSKGRACMQNSTYAMMSVTDAVDELLARAMNWDETLKAVSGI